jgi:hypothetical protein
MLECTYEISEANHGVLPTCVVPIEESFFLILYRVVHFLVFIL